MAIHDAHIATDENRARIKELVSFGITQENIGKMIGVSVDTLDRHYRHELDVGVDEANSKIAGSLFQKALSGDTSSMIFWLKTRARWKEAKEEDKKDTIIEMLLLDKQKSE